MLHRFLPRAITLSLVCLCALAPAASATWPGDVGVALVGHDSTEHGAAGLATASLTGTPAPLASTDLGGQVLDARWAADGSKIALRINAYDYSSRLAVVNADGTGLRVLDDNIEALYGLTWSPDGTRVLYSREGSLWIADDAAEPNPRVFATVPGAEAVTAPDWSVKDRIVATYRTLQMGQGNSLVTMDASGGDQKKMGGNFLIQSPQWSPDGTRILYTHQNGTGGGVEQGIYTVGAALGARKTLIAARTVAMTYRKYLNRATWLPTGAGIVFQRSAGIVGTDSNTNWIINASGGTARPLNQKKWTQLYGIQPVPKSGCAGVDPNGEGCNPACAVKTFGPFVAKGCFRRSGGVWRATGKVEANGVTIDPGNGALVFNTRTGVLSSTGKVEVRLTGDASTVLFRGKLAWEWKRAIAVTLPAALDVRGIPARGTAQLQFSSANGGSAIATLNLEVPRLGVQGVANVAISQSGFDLTGVQLSAKHVQIPPRAARAITLENLTLTYSDSNGGTWVGDATLVLPISKLGKIGAGISVANGDVSQIRASYDFPGVGAPFGSSGVYLQRIDAAVTIEPFGLHGGATMTAGPQITIGDRELAAVSGTATVDWSSNGRCSGWKDAPKSDLFTFTGTLKLAEIVTAEGSLCVMLNGFAEFDANLSFDRGPVKATGRAQGWVTDKKFSLEQDASVEFEVDPAGPGSISITKGVNSIVTSKGIGGCWGRYTYFPGKRVDLGFRHNWKSGKTKVTCNTKPLKVKRPKAVSRSGRVTAFAESGVLVERGTPSISFDVDGQPGGALPRMELIAPDDSRLVTPSVIGANDETGAITPAMGDVLFVGSPESNSLQILVANPAAGTWRLTPAVGSAPAVAIVAEQAVTKPVVRGKVKRDRRGYILSWATTNLNGATIDFVEEGAGVGRVLFSTRSASGTKRFIPVKALSSKRRVVAVLSDTVGPISRTNLGAPFLAPKAGQLKAPRVLKLSRSRTGVVALKWGAVPGSARYVVTAVTGKGLRSVFSLEGRALSITNPLAPGARISIAAIDQFGRAGRSTKLAAPR